VRAFTWHHGGWDTNGLWRPRGLAESEALSVASFPRSECKQWLVTRHISTAAGHRSCSLFNHFCRSKLPTALTRFIDEPRMAGRQLNSGKRKLKNITHGSIERTNLQRWTICTRFSGE
jgi:hypothetical protein